MSFLCGCTRRKRRKTGGATSAKGDKSLKNKLRQHGDESTVLRTVMGDNSRLQHENVALRRELEFQKAVLRTDPDQDRELAANLGLPFLGEPHPSARGLRIADSGSSSTDRASRSASFILPEPQSTAPQTAQGVLLRDGENSIEDSDPRSARERRGSQRHVGRSSYGDAGVDRPEGPLSGQEAGHDDIESSFEDCADGDACSRQYANERPTSHHKPEMASAISQGALTFVDDHFDNGQGPEPKKEEIQLQLECCSKESCHTSNAMCLPEKVLRCLDPAIRPAELNKLEKEYWDNKLKELKENMVALKREQDELVKEKAAELGEGQRGLQDGLKALEEMLTAGRQPSSPSPQAHCLPPHIVGIALDVQDKFFTVAIVKDFFRRLGMNPTEVERSVQALDGPCGPRDIFWSLLVVHDLALSKAGKALNMADFLDACDAVHIPTWQCSVMPRAHRRVLENCLLDLIPTLDVKLLQPFLTATGIMTSPSVREYVMDCTTPEQVMRLLDVLPMLGESALPRLMQVLLETRQEHVAKILADELERVEGRAELELREEAEPNVAEGAWPNVAEGAGPRVAEGAGPNQAGHAPEWNKSLRLPRGRSRRRTRRARSLYGRTTSVDEAVHVHYDHANETVTMATASP